jgi:hypothetical protein
MRKISAYLNMLTGLSAAVLLAIPSCKKVDSNDLKDSVPYYQKYSVSYDKDNNKTVASATFRIRESNGATVELGDSASVTANGISPNASLLVIPATYGWDLSGIVDVNFELTKSGGLKIANSVAKTDIGDIAFPSNMPLAISKATGLTFNWAGDALTSGEMLTVKVTGSSASSSIPAIIDKPVTGGQVTISSSEFDKFAPGTIFVTLKRAKTLPLDTKDGTSDGAIDLSRQTKIDIALNN